MAGDHDCGVTIEEHELFCCVPKTDPSHVCVRSVAGPYPMMERRHVTALCSGGMQLLP